MTLHQIHLLCVYKLVSFPCCMPSGGADCKVRGYINRHTCRCRGNRGIQAREKSIFLSVPSSPCLLASCRRVHCLGKQQMTLKGSSMILPQLGLSSLLSAGLTPGYPYVILSMLINPLSQLRSCLFMSESPCRGKVSEGLDFSDRAGRAVVITGIPFANSRDAKVKALATLQI